MRLSRKIVPIFGIFMFLLFTKCSSNTDIDDISIDELSEGSGFFIFNYTAPNFSKTLRVFYHIPNNAVASTPILMVFHGVSRNAKDYRNAFVNASNAKNFIVIAPEFSDENFPQSDQYNLGNVYVDGDNPTSNSLNPESQWSFSIVEKLFDFIKSQLKNTSSSYKIFGHSAGAQFAHRFLMFKPNNRANQTVISAAGWYTLPDATVPFPYGLKNSILESSTSDIFFAKNIFVQVGEFDNNPNDANLRHNFYADAQGLQRLERATNYVDFCKQQAKNSTFDFNWTLYIHKNADHNYIIAAQNASNLLF